MGPVDARKTEADQARSWRAPRQAGFDGKASLSWLFCFDMKPGVLLLELRLGYASK